MNFVYRRSGEFREQCPILKNVFGNAINYDQMAVINVTAHIGNIYECQIDLSDITVDDINTNALTNIKLPKPIGFYQELLDLLMNPTLREDVYARIVFTVRVSIVAMVVNTDDLVPPEDCSTHWICDLSIMSYAKAYYDLTGVKLDIAEIQVMPNRHEEVKEIIDTTISDNPHVCWKYLLFNVSVLSETFIAYEAYKASRLKIEFHNSQKIFINILYHGSDEEIAKMLTNHIKYGKPSDNDKFIYAALFIYPIKSKKIPMIPAMNADVWIIYLHCLDYTAEELIRMALSIGDKLIPWHSTAGMAKIIYARGDFNVKTEFGDLNGCNTIMVSPKGSVTEGLSVTFKSDMLLCELNELFFPKDVITPNTYEYLTLSGDFIKNFNTEHGETRAKFKRWFNHVEVMGILANRIKNLGRIKDITDIIIRWYLEM